MKCDAWMNVLSWYD